MQDRLVDCVSYIKTNQRNQDLLFLGEQITIKMYPKLLSRLPPLKRPPHAITFKAYRQLFALVKKRRSHTNRSTDDEYRSAA